MTCSCDSRSYVCDGDNWARHFPSCCGSTLPRGRAAIARATAPAALRGGAGRHHADAAITDEEWRAILTDLDAAAASGGWLMWAQDHALKLLLLVNALLLALCLRLTPYFAEGASISDGDAATTSTSTPGAVVYGCYALFGVFLLAVSPVLAASASDWLQLKMNVGVMRVAGGRWPHALRANRRDPKVTMQFVNVSYREKQVHRKGNLAALHYQDRRVDFSEHYSEFLIFHLAQDDAAMHHEPERPLVVV